MARLTLESLNRVTEQSAGSRKALKKAFRQLTVLPSRAQVLEFEVKFLHLQINEVTRTRDGTINFVDKKGWKAKMLESRLDF